MTLKEDQALLTAPRHNANQCTLDRASSGALQSQQNWCASLTEFNNVEISVGCISLGQRARETGLVVTLLGTDSTIVLPRRRILYVYT